MNVIQVSDEFAKMNRDEILKLKIAFMVTSIYLSCKDHITLLSGNNYIALRDGFRRFKRHGSFEISSIRWLGPIRPQSCAYLCGKIEGNQVIRMNIMHEVNQGCLGCL